MVRSSNEFLSGCILGHRHSGCCDVLY